MQFSKAGSVRWEIIHAFNSHRYQDVRFHCKVPETEEH